MSDYSLAMIADYIVEAENGTPSPLYLATLRSLLSEVRPPVPFDLEPSELDGQPIYSTTQTAQRHELHSRYDSVRMWHDIDRRLSNLIETSRIRRASNS